jgi:hypothetical protein
MNSDQTSIDESRSRATLDIIEYDPHMTILKWSETVVLPSIFVTEEMVRDGLPETSILTIEHVPHLPVVHVEPHHRVGPFHFAYNIKPYHLTSGYRYKCTLLNADLELSDLCLMRISDEFECDDDHIFVFLNNVTMDIMGVAPAGNAFHKGMREKECVIYTVLCRREWCSLK